MKRTNHFAAILVCALAGFAAATLVAESDAEACGGLFCNQQRPVNQAAERIIFADHPDGTVSAIIQIMYEGPSEKFAWVLPVPSVPEVKLSSDAAFQTLQSQTNPQYRLNTTVEGECKQEEFANNGASVDAGQNAPTADGTNNGGTNNGVNVLDSGTAGPYDYDVIEVDSGVSDKVQVALDWLSDNGYDTTSLAPTILESYLNQEKKLVAFKLTKNADSGDIRPVFLNYENDVPCIPIKLTAVAANDDMGVLVWVLGEERAFPLNYKSLELNEAAINWFNPNSNYNQVVSMAANEAMGQGFVTEFAGDASDFQNTIYTDTDAQTWDSISGEDWTDRGLELLDRVWSTYNRFDRFGQPVAWDGMREAVNAGFPRQTKEVKDRILQCGRCAFEDSGTEFPTDFDPQQFVDAVYDFVVEPMEQTQALIDDFGYMTRLYTTMSAMEMTVDPLFDFNPDLPDVSNQHVEERIIECSPDVYRWEAPWRVEFDNGLVVRGTDNSWPLSPDDDLPATRIIKQDSTSGDGEVVTDNTETIRQTLEEHNQTVPGPSGNGADGNGIDWTGGKDYGGGDGSKGSGGCSVAGGASGLGASVLLMVMLLGFRRRRDD